MNATPAHYTVSDLVELQKQQMLVTNPEYQRGVVWSEAQQKKLIDSVLRGYPLPLIYLHDLRRVVAGRTSERLEIIDGQQRLTSLYRFAEGAFSLFDPVKDDREARFPEFVKHQPCPWARCTLQTLTDEDRERFLMTPLAVVTITTDEVNEARDLFIRLQGGLPLTAQEKRDAWPGHFTDFILRTGGKPEIARYPGHPFFHRVMRMRPGSDRGKARQTAAQLAALFLHRRAHGETAFTDLNARSIDEVYYRYLDFDVNGPEARRFTHLLDFLDDALGGGKRPIVRIHEAIHALLLVDSLWDGYTRSWTGHFADAFDAFAEEQKRAKQLKDSDQPPAAWTRYGQWTRVNSDAADRIARRHEFYVERMLHHLGTLEPKDPTRGFSATDRELVYYRDAKRCAVCGAEVPWKEAEIHHVVEHARGGSTTMENGVLVHAHCHPKGHAAVEFEQQHAARASSPQS